MKTYKMTEEQRQQLERIATACMAGIFSNSSTKGESRDDVCRVVANISILGAKALIAELDKEPTP